MEGDPDGGGTAPPSPSHRLICLSGTFGELRCVITDFSFSVNFPMPPSYVSSWSCPSTSRMPPLRNAQPSNTRIAMLTACTSLTGSASRAARTASTVQDDASRDETPGLNRHVVASYAPAGYSNSVHGTLLLACQINRRALLATLAAADAPINPRRSIISLGCAARS